MESGQTLETLTYHTPDKPFPPPEWPACTGSAVDQWDRCNEGNPGSWGLHWIQWNPLPPMEDKKHGLMLGWLCFRGLISFAPISRQCWSLIFLHLFTISKQKFILFKSWHFCHNVIGLNQSGLTNQGMFTSHVVNNSGFWIRQYVKIIFELRCRSNLEALDKWRY